MKLWFKHLKFIDINLCVCLFFLLISSVEGFSQNSVKTISIDSSRLTTKLFNQDQGLSQGMISCLLEDHKGYLWIGTKDGLNRYDGKHFKVFKPNPLDSNSISDGYITCIFEDSQKRIWVGTPSGGLNFYDRKKDRFVSFKQDSAKSNSLYSNSIYAITEVSESQLLIKLDGQEFFQIAEIKMLNNEVNEFEINFYPLSKLESKWKEKSTKFNKFEKHIIYDSTVWIFSSNLGVIRIPLTQNKKKSFEPKKLKNLYPIRNYYSKELYLIANGKKLVVFNPKNDSLRTVLHLPDSLTFGRIIFIDLNNCLWLLQKSGRFIKINLNTNNQTYYSTDNVEVNKLIKSNSIKKVLVDAYNNFWFGTNGAGLIKASDFSNHFKKISFDEKLTFQNFKVSTIAHKAVFNKSIQNIWFKRNIVEYMDANNFNYRNNSSHSYALDGDSTLWISRGDSGNYVKSIFGFTTKRGFVKSIKLSPPVVASDGLGVKRFFIGKNGDIWFYTEGSGLIGTLNHLNKESLNITSYKIPTKLKYADIDFISDWEIDSKGNFWFATVDGIKYFDVQGHKWKTFHDSDNDKSLSSRRTLSILNDPIDPDLFIWVGTNGGGLNKMNKLTGECEVFTEFDGLPNNVIYGILADEKNNLWLSTNLGLALFKTSTNKIQSFNKGDGLPFLEFNRYNYSKDNQGRLYFEGSNTLVRVNPSAFYENQKTQKVLINQLKIKNQPVKYGNNFEEYTLPASIEYCSALNFTHNENMISFGFSLLDLTNPIGNKYKYKLEGFNSDWIDAGEEHEAIYTNLDPGKYIFKVKGANSLGLWSDPTSLEVIILTPWWESWWFISLIVLCLTSAIYSLYRYRLAQGLRVERIRNDIAQDLHDEIGSTISSISLYSAVLLTKPNYKTDDSKKLLEKIINSASSAMSTMNDLVWTIKVENDNFHQVVNRLRAFAVNMTESQEIDLEFNCDENAEGLSLKMNQRKNIYLIFKEAINNATKYSEAEKIRIDIHFFHKELIISIRDNGKGFQFADEEQHVGLLGGNGIPGMYLRAEQMNATLQVESTIDQGTIISLQLIL
jgi:ligand-binding sensor domain-containing protein/two-component sensor histidine kinase